jgi:predicted enzyme related to lactoylglutathione lyase
MHDVPHLFSTTKHENILEYNYSGINYIILTLQVTLLLFFYTLEVYMNRVTGIGGIFFKAKDPVALRTWYQKHLGIDVQVWGGATFRWADDKGNPVIGTTIWNISDASGHYFDPSSSSFMVNYRVDNLHALIYELRKEGCNVLDKTEESEFGKFGWVIDPEGNKVELWEPPMGQ